MWDQKIIAFVKESNRLTAGGLLIPDTSEWQDIKSFSVPVRDTRGGLWYGCFSACHELLRESLASKLEEAKIPARFVVLQGFLTNPNTQEYGDLWAVVRSSNQAILHQHWTLKEAFDRALEAFNLSKE